MALPTKMVPASSHFLAHRKVLLCHSLVSGLIGFCMGQTCLALPRSLLLTLRTQNEREGGLFIPYLRIHTQAKFYCHQQSYYRCLRLCLFTHVFQIGAPVAQAGFKAII